MSIISTVKEKFKRGCKLSVQILTLISLLNLGLVIYQPSLLIDTYEVLMELKGDSLNFDRRPIRQVFRDLQQALPVDISSQLRLIIVESPISNAYASADGTITIYTGIVEEMNWDSGQLAAVLGHEIAHVVLKHHYNGLQSSIEKEYYADLLGITLAIKAGYKGCNIVKFWVRRVNKQGDVLNTTTHPNSVTRAVYLDQFCQNVRR